MLVTRSPLLLLRAVVQEPAEKSRRSGEDNEPNEEFEVFCRMPDRVYLSVPPACYNQTTLAVSTLS